jgi:ABC-type polar amino acid transport system ATPase subunit
MLHPRIYLTDDPKTIDVVRREVGMVFPQFNLFRISPCCRTALWRRRKRGVSSLRAARLASTTQIPLRLATYSLL